MTEVVSRRSDEEPMARDAVAESPPDGAAVMSRRSLLHHVGVGAATVVVAGVGVGSYRVFDNGVLNAGHGTAYDAWSKWRSDPTPLGAVAAAILAANPHNTQPWIFHVTANSIDVFSDPARQIGALDSLNREHHIGLGCAVENLVLASNARGWGSTVTWLPNASDPTHVATVALTSAAPIASALHDAIGDRHSNRGPYTNKPVSSENLASLYAVADGLEGVSLQWFTTDADRSALGMLIIDATKAIIDDEQQSKDSFAWFRNNRDDIVNHADGLTLDAQGLSPLVLAMAKILPPTSRVAGDKFWLDQTRTVQTATAAAYGVITVVDPNDPRQRLIGGRLLQRIHLAATVQGLGLQHINQITERIDRDAKLAQPSKFASSMAALVSDPARSVLSTFRIGHPVRVGRPSPRRAISQVIR
jgi:hypothetical protein